MHQPHGKPVIAIAMEDEETAEDVLRSYHMKILSQDELIDEFSVLAFCSINTSGMILSAS